MAKNIFSSIYKAHLLEALPKHTKAPFLPWPGFSLHQSFLQGQFVVKRTGKFKAVAAVQSLEQTINRSQKSSGGIIGSTRKKTSLQNGR